MKWVVRGVAWALVWCVAILFALTAEANLRSIHRTKCYQLALNDSTILCAGPSWWELALRRVADH